jgi:hypothetical protein
VPGEPKSNGGSMDAAKLVEAIIEVMAELGMGEVEDLKDGWKGGLLEETYISMGLWTVETNDDDELYFSVMGVIPFEIPEKAKERAELYEGLLSLNMEIPGDLRIGLVDGEVIAGIDRPLEPTTVEDMTAQVREVAGFIDDLLEATDPDLDD